MSNVTKDGAPYRSYVYDANGNRTSATEDGGAAVTGTFDAQDRLTSYGSTSYEHNAMGQRTSKTAGTDTTTYDYDELGSLMKVTLPNKTIDYVVDGLGRRVARKVDGTITNRFVYGQSRFPVAELNNTGGIQSQFIYASKGNVPDVMIKNGVPYRFVTDQIGSVRLVVDSSTGAVAQQIDYDPFGKVISDTNPGFQPFGFAGGLYDPDTGLVRFGHRDYDAQTGRWTARDPVLFDGADTNLYAYVWSDPINLFDPLGLDGTDYWDIEEHMEFWGEQAEAGATNPNPVAGFFQWGTSKLLGAALDASGLDTVQASAVTIGDICSSGWDKAKSFGSIGLVGVSWYGGGSTTATGNSARFFGSNARRGTRIFGLRNRFGEKFYTDTFGYFLALDRKFHRLHLFGKGYWFKP